MPLGWSSAWTTPGTGLEHLCFGKGPHLCAEFAAHLLSAGASWVAQMVKSPPVMQEIRVQSLGQEHPLEKGMAYPLQCFCLENPMDRGSWEATVHGVASSRT